MRKFMDKTEIQARPKKMMDQRVKKLPGTSFGGLTFGDAHRMDLVNEVETCERVKGFSFQIRENKRSLNKGCRRLMEKIQGRITDTKDAIRNKDVIISRT